MKCLESRQRNSVYAGAGMIGSRGADRPRKIGIETRVGNDRAAYLQGKADFIRQLVQPAIAQS